MKNFLFGLIALIAFSISGFAVNTESSTNQFNDSTNVECATIQNNESTFHFVNDFDFEESCTITSVTTVISNGEITHVSTTLFHIDGMSCKTFFSRLALAMSAW